MTVVPRNTLCFETNLAGFPILLTQQGTNKFTVQYGEQTDSNLSYSRACSELGASIMHALACEGKLNQP